MYLQIFSLRTYLSTTGKQRYFRLHVTTTVFYASESIFIILLGPLFAWLMEYAGTQAQNPSTISKFVLGIFFAGLASCFKHQYSISRLTPASMHPGWIFLAYLLVTIGELFLSPIGLSAVTMLAPANLVSFMMGIWFVATGFGGVFAGTIAKLSSVPITDH